MSIVIDNVSFTYSKKTPFETKAVDGVSLKIEQGDFLGIIGHTGSGKTTLIQMIAGLLDGGDGAIYVNDLDINEKGYDRKQLRKAVGVVFQYPEYQLFEETVYMDIAFAPKKAGFNEQEIEKAVRKTCALLDFDIDAYKDKSPFELSGGQKRKVAIAGVLAVDPDILILDEPVAGLDPQGRKSLMDLITTLNEQGKTIIMITHSMDDLAMYAKRVVVMENGQIAYDETPKLVFSHADRLLEMSLDIPEATKIVRSLNDMGKDFPADIISIDELNEHIVRKLKAKGKI
jgi:energy-coupling factor transport system ATP-binding protein